MGTILKYLDNGEWKPFLGDVPAPSNSIVSNNTPTGDIDGTNTVFITGQPYIPGSLEVYVNGLLQVSGIHYTETNPATGEFTFDEPPLTGDNIVCNYMVANTATGNADTLDGYHASATPTPNTIPVLNSNMNFQQGALLGDVKYYTSSDTWTKPAGLKYVIVEVQGGGGGGGGAGATASNQVAYGVGGTGGVYARKKIDFDDLSSTETVTVGAGSAAALDPSNGGDSSFGSHCIAAGGIAGNRRAGSTTVGNFNTGRTSTVGSSVGDIIIPGGPGGGGQSNPVNNTNIAQSGQGGDSVFGRGGMQVAANNVGQDGSGYGGGGSGAAHTANQSARVGGAGADGIVIVWEYF